MAYTTIDDPSAYFQAEIYTGSGSTGHARTFDSDTNMQPDMVWIKSRSYGSVDHRLWDVTRGVTKTLMPSDDVAESTAYELTSFDSDGFTLNTTDNSANGSSKTYVAWCWNTQGGAGSSNTDGSINTTTTSVNTTSKFSISTYTGTGSNATIGHGLGVKPDCIIVKRRDDASRWQMYTSVFGATKYFQLDENAGVLGDDDTRWQDTEPTTTVFSIGTNGRVNESTGTFVAYCWASVQGYSKVGSFIGNGNADGAFGFCGFRPAYIMLKSKDGSSPFTAFDNKREGYNVDNNLLKLDVTESEPTSNILDIVSNGFKLRTADDVAGGESGREYFYMAFAEQPFVNSNGVPCNAR